MIAHESKNGISYYPKYVAQTHDVNLQTADSASSGTALFSGIKTIHSTIGFDSSVVKGDATSQVTLVP